MSLTKYLPKKEFLLSKRFLSILAFIFMASFLVWAVYLYNPKVIPKTVRVANDKIVDKVIGKELAQAIDVKRNSDGAVSIRTLFNTNKEQNLDRFCKKKTEQGKEKEKCFKKYVNEEFGYSLKYPVDFSIFKETSDNVVFAKEEDISVLNEAEQKSIDTDTPFTFGRTISVGMLENSEGLSVENYIKKEIMVGGEGTYELKENINGIKGYYILEKGPNRFGGGIGEYFIFSKDNKLFSVWLDHEVLTSEKNLELSAIFISILESIKYE